MSRTGDSTLFAAFYGDLVAHPSRAGAVPSADAYSLFVARSSAMEWLTAIPEVSLGTGIWEMNDATQGPAPGSPERVASFQVSLPEPVVAGRPPVQAFLSCAADVLARLGNLRLTALQILLPVHAIEAPTGASTARMVTMRLLQDSGWFADTDPSGRSPVLLTLDGGQDPAIKNAAPEMVRWLQQINQDVITVDSFSTASDQPPAIATPIIDELWAGPARHQVTVRCTLIEWSVDALAWSAAFLADTSARYGVNGTLLLTAQRHQPPHLGHNS